MSGKGDTPRPGDSQRYREEYDRIFRRVDGVIVAPKHVVFRDCHLIEPIGPWWELKQGRTDDNPT